MKLFGMTLTPLVVVNMISSSRTLILSAGGALIGLGLVKQDIVAEISGVLLNLLTLLSIIYSNVKNEDMKVAAIQTGAAAQADATNTDVAPHLDTAQAITAALNTAQLKIAAKPTIVT